MSPPRAPALVGAHHAPVHLCLVFPGRSQPPAPDRLPRETLARIEQVLTAASTKLREPEAADPERAELPRMYEPHANAVAIHFVLALPPGVPAETRLDGWQVSE